MRSSWAVVLGRWTAVLCLASGLPARADLVSLTTDADATLMEWVTTNSMGAAPWFSAGTTQNGPRARGLLRFNIAAAIPAGSKIVSAELRLSVTEVPSDGNAESAFTLRRVFFPWTEGTNVQGPISPGFGNPAQVGDSTWTHRAWGTTNTWAEPGLLEGVDFSATVSTVTVIGGLDRYTFEATREAAADVQFWLDHPESNCGWLLKTEAEDTRFTARRFGSRELGDPFESPELMIQYTPPPQIADPRLVGNRLQFSFPVAYGISYRVEFSSGLPAGTNWMVLTNLPPVFQPSTATVYDTVTATQRYYRVRSQF